MPHKCVLLFGCALAVALGALVAAVSICLQPVDDGCGVFHAYQTVISQLRENYHFLLRVTFQRSHRTLNPSCIKWIVDTLICLFFFFSSLLLPLCPGVMTVIPFRKKNKESRSIVFCFFSSPFPLPSCLRAVVLLLLLLLVLFFRGSRCGCVVHFDPFSSFAHTDTDNGLRHTGGTVATRKRQAVFFFFFSLRSPSEEWRVGGRARS